MCVSTIITIPPTLLLSGAAEEITYTLTLKFPDWPSNTRSVVYGHALLNAQIDAASGPYPLVILSHGFGLNASWYHTLAEHHASHGFVVLAPEHIEQDWMGNMTAAIDRPRDIQGTLDFAERLAAPGGIGILTGDAVQIEPVPIDMNRVAIVGHSYGGYTALAMAGARFDFAALKTRCAALAAEDPHNFLCMPLLGNEGEMAAYAGLDAVPEGLWPSFGDPRITTIIAIAGDGYCVTLSRRCTS